MPKQKFSFYWYLSHGPIHPNEKQFSLSLTFILGQKHLLRCVSLDMLTTLCNAKLIFC